MNDTAVRDERSQGSEPLRAFEARLQPVLAGLRGQPWVLGVSIGDAPSASGNEVGPGDVRVPLSVAGHGMVLELRWRPGVPERDVAIALAVDAARALAAQETAEQRLERIEQLARAHSPLRSVASLLAGLAHDIRSPLTSIVCNVQALEELASGDREVSEALGDAKLGCDRIEELVRSVRLLTDADVGTARVDVAECVQAAVHLLRLRSSRTGVSVDASVEPALVALANPTELCQVIYQLLENALDVSPRGTAVRLRARRASDTCVIEVRDTGPGIGGREREEVFLPFRTRKPRALGTNLASARAAVRRHGGELRLEDPSSSPGACFVVELPLPA